jgi:glycine cleavage system protein P-like pyridoxal-binding family
MLIEPTESVGRQDLDAFVEAMQDINTEAQENPQLVIDAPHSTGSDGSTKRRQRASPFCAGSRIWKLCRKQLSFR